MCKKIEYQITIIFLSVISSDFSMKSGPFNQIHCTNNCQKMMDTHDP